MKSDTDENDMDPTSIDLTPEAFDDIVDRVLNPQLPNEQLHHLMNRKD